MEKFSIGGMFKKLFSKEEEKKEQGGAHARRDWGILLIIFITLNIIVIVFSTYLFLQIDKGTIFVVESMRVESAMTFDQAQLDDVLLFYEKKELEFERLKIDIGDIPSVR